MNFHHDLKFDVGHKLQFRARMKTVQLKDTEIIYFCKTEVFTLGVLYLQSGIDSRVWPYKNSHYDGV